MTLELGGRRALITPDRQYQQLFRAPAAGHDPGLCGVEGWLRGLSPTFGWGEDWDEIERRALKEFAPNSCGRIRRPEDIALAVAYLASPQARLVTGADMMVTGG